MSLPSVSVVIATRDRPVMLREAVDAVLAQHYVGDIEVVVVFDHSEPDLSLQRQDPGRTVRVIRNHHTPGLAGARNSGAEVAHHSMIAFCDDDDLWDVQKLEHQVPVLLVSDTPVVTTGISVAYDGASTTRVLESNVITFADLLRDRHTELHPSTFLMWRETLTQRLGGVDEEVPGGFGEDYDLLLRAARLGPLRHVRLPLVTIRWSGSSYFFQRWETMAAGLTWLLDAHPEFETQPEGSARVRGQIAFAHAAAGHRGQALRWGASAVSRNALEPRVPLATAVALGVPASSVMERLHRRGRGV